MPPREPATASGLPLTPSIIGGHAHRFRDTFAVSLLLKGVDLARVSILRRLTCCCAPQHALPFVCS